MLNISFKEYTRIRQLIAKRIKAKLENNIASAKIGIEEDEKYTVKSSEYYNLQEAVKLLQSSPGAISGENNFLYRALRDAKSRLQGKEEIMEKAKRDIKDWTTIINVNKNFLDNFKENYVEEYEYFNSLEEEITISCNKEALYSYEHAVIVFGRKPVRISDNNDMENLVLTNDLLEYFKRSVELCKFA